MERHNPIARDKFTGAVFCPLRQAEIAVMRCWEYQQSNGCGLGCKNAAKIEIVEGVKGELRQDGDFARTGARLPGRASERCACGRRKSPQGKTCRRCHLRNTRIVYHDACVKCGAAKGHNQALCCQSCGGLGRTDRRGRGDPLFVSPLARGNPLLISPLVRGRKRGGYSPQRAR